MVMSIGVIVRIAIIELFIGLPHAAFSLPAGLNIFLKINILPFIYHQGGEDQKKREQGKIKDVRHV